MSRGYFIRYRFDMIGAQIAGDMRHPEQVIRETFPEATRLEPVPIADCWLFDAEARAVVPPHFRALPRRPCGQTP